MSARGLWQRLVLRSLLASTLAAVQFVTPALFAQVTGDPASATPAEAAQAAPDAPSSLAGTQPATPAPAPAAAGVPSDAPGAERGRGSRTPTPAAAARLPADSTTEHALDLPGRTLRFAATAGSIPLYDGDRNLQAEVGYVAYVVPGAAKRPVAFAVNGGPGASSAYLHIGAMGPWRLPFENIQPSSPPVLVPNIETWLDFTDLVFIDPVGTGYSRAAISGDAVRRRFWSIDGDIESLAAFVRKWIEKSGRQTSPKFLVGESYGGFRVPRLARALQDGEGVGASGMVLISPVLDFGWRISSRHSPLPWVGRLPSMMAAARELNGAPFDREALREAERYAAGDYLLDLLRGERDTAAMDRMSKRVSALTGLDPAVVQRSGGRITASTFEREILRDRGLVASSYDATVTAYDPNPYAPTSRYSDPQLHALSAPLIGAMTDLYRSKLNWQVDGQYQLLNGEVNSRWEWGRGRSLPQNVDDLRAALALDKRVRVLATHGATDMVTPYFETQLILDQLPAYGSPDRIELKVYGGGHMFYSRDTSRRALRNDAEALFRATQDVEPAARD